jgi:hypothetical protein
MNFLCAFYALSMHFLCSIRAGFRLTHAVFPGESRGPLAGEKKSRSSPRRDMLPLRILPTSCFLLLVYLNSQLVPNRFPNIPNRSQAFPNGFQAASKRLPNLPNPLFNRICLKRTPFSRGISRPTRENFLRDPHAEAGKAYGCLLSAVRPARLPARQLCTNQPEDVIPDRGLIEVCIILIRS